MKNIVVQTEEPKIEQRRIKKNNKNWQKLHTHQKKKKNKHREKCEHHNTRNHFNIDVN